MMIGHGFSRINIDQKTVKLIASGQIKIVVFSSAPADNLNALSVFRKTGPIVSGLWFVVVGIEIQNLKFSIQN